MGITIRVCAGLLALAASVHAQPSGELRFCLRADPKTFDPLLASEDASETVRYLTAGVLIRFNRQTQKLEPELAASWQVRDGGKRIEFVLRRGVRFSDGAPFGPADVVATVRRLMTPDLGSPIADSFRPGGGAIRAEAAGQDKVSVVFSAPIAGVEQLFDQLAIVPDRPVPPGKATLGAFFVADYKGGQYVQLQRNPYYWKPAAGGQKLPRVNTVRLDIQANREAELLRFRRGEIHFVDKLEPEAFDRLSKEMPAAAVNAGPSLDSEFLWFNQVPTAPLPPHKQLWFRSTAFRTAISAAVNRDDLIRVVYRGHAHPSAGPVSSANKLWYNSALPAPRYDTARALDLLRKDGFRLDGQTLRDRSGNAVEFSLITNAGNHTREQIGAMLQQDLKKIGIRVNLVPLEFQSLISRITSSNDYEACLLGLTNVEIDPNNQMNVWMSSGTHHPWNPGQAKPATAWEAEIDALMRKQATALSQAARKQAFDQVQRIVSEQAPAIYLVNPGVLCAVSPSLRGAAPSPLPPHLYWNVEQVAVCPPPCSPRTSRWTIPEGQACFGAPASKSCRVKSPASSAKAAPARAPSPSLS